MARQMARRPRGQRLAHEVVARDVVARVEAVEIAPHLGQLFLAVGGERRGRFVGGAALALGRQLLRKVGGGGEFGGAARHVDAKRLRIAGQARDRLGKVLAAGVVTLLFSHIFINIGMNIRLMPVTGIPLPLLSYGGSSVLGSLIAMGLLQIVHIYRRGY